MLHILFLCVANSVRSQMAEGLAQQIFGPAAWVESAGSHPGRLHPEAVAVMAEIGIDISGQFSKSFSTIETSSLDYVITLCAEEFCPSFSGRAQRLHWPIDDPIGGNLRKLRQNFRETRDELKRRIEDFRRNILGVQGPAIGSHNAKLK